jgi:hypothetical protein
MNETQKATGKGAPGYRFRLGLIIFVIGFSSPLLIPLVAASSLSTKWKSLISGGLALGIPEVFSILAIAIMGKSGFNYMKDRIFTFLKKHAPPDRVSPRRYRIGLVMFVVPILLAWLGPYVLHLVPGYAANRIVVSLTGDLIFLTSFFVLGGEFWDKVRALFNHGAKAQFPVPLGKSS